MSGAPRDLDGVAVVGMAGRFPGAPDLDAFWRNLRDGVESISVTDDAELRRQGVDPALLADPAYVRAKGVLEGADGFDAAFFGMTPREAELSDPQHRLLLECASAALEHAACDPGRYPGMIGLFAGAGVNSYLLENLMPRRELLRAAGPLQTSLLNKGDHLTTRVAYKLGLGGPCLTVQTACSTSLVAVCLACQSLLDYQCDAALAGGVSVRVPLRGGYLHQVGGIHSPDGHCRAFDAAAAGTVDGDGVGVVVLKRLADALADGDRVWAVIRGFAVNNDGAERAGYTAPSLDRQAEVIAAAHAAAGVEAAAVGYVEAHGTGTPLGDPIEVAALTRAFRLSTERTGFCGLGSVKTNIGHLDAAAGVAGLLKAVLALHHRQLPPSLHYSRPNPRLDLAASPFYVCSRLAEWPGPAPRCAGVSSFGLGGTNAHVVLEEAPEPPAGDPPGRPWRLLLLSTATAPALETATDRLATHLRGHPDLELSDAAYTLATGRRRHPYRRAVLCRDRDDALEALEGLHPRRVTSRLTEEVDPPVLFMFPGQGSQHAGMAAEVYRGEPLFRRHLDELVERFAPHLGRDLREVLFAPPDRRQDAARELDGTGLTQPALFAVEVALARQWMEWGVRPQAMIGHSLGEYVAACLAGVLSLDDAVRLVALRGRLIQELPGGAMLAVALPARELAERLAEPLALAAVNGPAMCVVSGPEPAVRELAAELDGRGVVCRPLATSHAFHSSMMDPVLEPFRRALDGLVTALPEIPYVSNVTGTWITADDLATPEYWVRHLRATVRFADGVEPFLRDPAWVLLEVGPGRALKNVTRWHPGRSPGQAVETSLPYRGEERSDHGALLQALGRLWLAGVEVDWGRFYGDERRRRLALPTYPFARRRYWIERLDGDAAAAGRTVEKRPDPADWFYLPVWREVPPLAPWRPEASARWLVLTDGEGLGGRLVERLRRAGGRVATVAPGGGLRRLAEDAWELHPGRRADYDGLLAELAAADALPDRVLHLWSLAAAAAEPPPTAEVLERGYTSLVLLAQTVAALPAAPPLDLTVVSRGVQEVTGGEPLLPAWATLLGPCRVIPRELDGARCRSVDLEVSPAPTGRHGEARLEAVVGALLAEAAGGAADPVVAYRGGRRWVEGFAPVRLEAAGEPPLRHRGVYLVSGGLGGIGLELAEHLARERQARLVLFGRSAFPEPAGWGRLLADHPPDDPVSVTIRRLQRLEEAGAELLVARADVTDRQAVAALVDRAVARFGRIDGVFHAAGVADGRLLQLRSGAEDAAVLAPKLAGTEALAAALGDRELDCFVLFSSLATVVGRPGQAAYTAGNAFLDAFARLHARRGAPVLAVDWGEWQGVGMARRGPLRAAEAPAPAGAAAEQGTTVELDHPFLDRRTVLATGQEVYRTEFSVRRHWVLDEHRLVGTPVIPGVAYIEMVRAALAGRADGRVIELSDVFFLAPLRVREDQRREVRLLLSEEGEGFRFQVESDGDDGSAQRFALGRAALRPRRERPTFDLDELIERCRGREELFSDEEREDDLGPRWQNVQRAYVGEREVLTCLELTADFAADLERMGYHPALMDRATGRAQEYLIDGVYMPVAYRRLTLHAPVPARIYSHARYRPEEDPGRETLVFDTRVLDAQGRLVVEAEGFTQKRINDAAVAIKSFSVQRQGTAEEAPPATARVPPPAAAGQDGAAAAGEGPSREMTAGEGIEALGRILARRPGPRVVVSVRDLEAVVGEADRVARERVAELAAPPPAAPAAHPRPELATAYVAPRSPRERRMAGVWAELLAFDRVGVDDNFFDLGGDSVLAIQIIARLTEAGFEVSPQAFFQHQTVAELAAAVGGAAPAAAAPVADARPDPTPAAVAEEELRKLGSLLAEADARLDGARPPAGEAPAEAAAPVPATARVEDDGRRVDLGRIEEVLRAHPAVRAARCRLRPGNGAEPEVVAEVVVDGAGGGARRGVELSLFYFADDQAGADDPAVDGTVARRDRYRLYVEGARFADRAGFAAVWTPERHFHPSGGLYPNPSVLSAALATLTERIRLRAGSVVLPLHDPIRVAEEWAVVDNLSGGRVDLAFTSGWIPNDFALSPRRFADKRGEMFRGIDLVRRLWRGETIPVRDGVGKETEVRIFPRPVQPELPLWLTCSGDPELFVRAGEMGLNVLTALLAQSAEEAAEKIALYRDARARAGHDPDAGRVTMMLHTFVGADEDEVLATVRAPLSAYLRSHVGLLKTMARSLEVEVDLDGEAWVEPLVAFAFERYYRSAALLGTPQACAATVERMRSMGVDEIACFIDFGVDVDAVLASLPALGALRERCSVAPAPDLPALARYLGERLPALPLPTVFEVAESLP